MLHKCACTIMSSTGNSGGGPSGSVSAPLLLLCGGGAPRPLPRPLHAMGRSYEILPVPLPCAVVMGVREAPTCANLPDSLIIYSAYLGDRDDYKLMCYTIS